MANEKLNEGGENFEVKEIASHENKEGPAEKGSESKVRSERAEKAPDIDAIKEKIDNEAKKAEEVLSANKAEKSDSDNSYLVTQELKSETYKRTIKKVQKKLSKSSRVLSKTIHQPVVSSISKVGEKTIARPTGILTGSIIALVGSSYVLFSAKRYGYKYNFTVVIILFVGGYLVGLIIEMISYFAKRLKIVG